MSKNLQGQSVLVIGGKHRIGAGIAAAARSAGATVHVASHEPDAGQIHLDLRDEESIASAAKHLGAVDHIVSTASLPHGVAIADLDRQKTIDAFAAKVIGPMLVAKHFTITQSFVLFSGQVGWRPARGSVVTGVTNGAAASVALHLAAELAPVRVNAISPGIVDSGAWDAKGVAKSQFLQAAADRTLVGHTGELGDVVDTVMWLLSAGFVTGETIHVEGGRP